MTHHVLYYIYAEPRLRNTRVPFTFARVSNETIYYIICVNFVIQIHIFHTELATAVIAVNTSFDKRI